MVSTVAECRYLWHAACSNGEHGALLPSRWPPRRLRFARPRRLLQRHRRGRGVRRRRCDPEVRRAEAVRRGPRKRRIDPDALRVALAHHRALRRRRRHGRRQLGQHHDVHLREHPRESRDEGGCLAHRARAEEPPGLRGRRRRLRRGHVDQGPRRRGWQAAGGLRGKGHRGARHRRGGGGGEAPEGDPRSPGAPRHRQPRDLHDARRRGAPRLQRERDQDDDHAARRVLGRRQPPLLPHRCPRVARARADVRPRR